MKKIGLLYGSTTGNTEEVAEMIANEIGSENVDVLDVANISMEDAMKYERLIMGTSTWGSGDLQDDWEEFVEALKEADLSGKKVALFGLGDQVKYPESFVDGLGTLYCWLPDKSVVVGEWPVDGYNYYFSLADKDGKFVGLVIDEHNQKELTDKRIKKWVAQLEKEFS